MSAADRCLYDSNQPQMASDELIGIGQKECGSTHARLRGSAYESRIAKLPDHRGDEHGRDAGPDVSHQDTNPVHRGMKS
jgi:hypothetical protein